MNFGVPSQRKVKVEKYPNNAIVTVGVDGGKGKSRQLIFNKRACELLNITDDSRIAFAFEYNTTKFALANTDQNGIDAKDGIRVTKSKPRKVSDKKTYNYIKKIMNLDTDVENLFELQLSTEDNGGLEVYDALPFIEGGVEVDGEIEDASMESNFSTFVAATDGDAGGAGDGSLGASVDDTIKSAHSFTND
jgi:hypothetical protein